MTIRYLPLSWTDYQTYAYKLAGTILAHSKPFDEIIAIARGGLPLGHMLSDFLQIPLSTITIQSYTNIQTQGEIRITAKLQTAIKDKRILLIDDIADSGKTLERGIAYLKEFAPSDVTTVTMFYKAKSIIRPDYYAKQTNRWVIFPYEATETILLITKNLRKEGKTKMDIQESLENLGYPPHLIAFAWRHHGSK